MLSGWFYGILLLALFILATRVVMGPARAPGEVAAGARGRVPRRTGRRPGPDGTPNGAKPERRG